MCTFSHLEWSRQKPKTPAPLFLFRTKPDVYFSRCVCSQISLTWAQTATNLRQLNPLSSHLIRVKIWPTYSRYLLFERHCLAALVVKSVGSRVWRTFSTQPKKRVLILTLCPVSTLWVKRRWGEAEVRRTCRAPKLLIKHLKRIHYKPFPPHKSFLSSGQQQVKSRPRGLHHSYCFSFSEKVSTQFSWNVL